ncbi:ATP-binding protein [Lyngbya aestuarii]|uniref:ATP-binding protein n=1 Tax=Lyngbya aestuarii TaxID=118322 RepID=UPI00403E22F6
MMLTVQQEKKALSLTTQSNKLNLSVNSRLEELSLYDVQVESSCLGKDVAQTFQVNQLLPGVILTDKGKFAGMISRRRFLEQMSRPYGVELFSRRPLFSLYSFVGAEVLKLSGKTQIVEAALCSLQRSPKLLYEPIVVEMESGIYRLLDAHQLLVAQSHIQQLTTQLLNEQTQAQMMQTEKMASLGKMVASVAHEIKNPVACITGNLGFLADYCQQIMQMLSVYEVEVTQTPEKVTTLKEEYDLDFMREDLPKIIKSMKMGSERLTKIIGGLQNFSHLSEAHLQPTDIHECLESILIILNNKLKCGIEVVKNYSYLPQVPCYSGQLSQVFMNIISNAIDALEDRASEQVGGSKTWQPRIEIKTEIVSKSEVDWVSVRIADNGPGIPPEIQQRIFENFFTTKPVGKGTGLGLAISHQIVTQKHGGQLLMLSEPSIGTEFQILLPLI